MRNEPGKLESLSSELLRQHLAEMPIALFAVRVEEYVPSEYTEEARSVMESVRAARQVELEQYRSGVEQEAAENRRAQKLGPKGIGGWLAWWAFQVLVLMLRSFYEYANPDPYAQASPLGQTYLVMTVFSVAVLFYGFMSERDFVPKLMISLIFSLGIIGAIEAESLLETVGHALFVAIWIGYWLRSKRVKNTFVK